MTERLKRRLHDEIITRWIDVRTPGHELYGRPDYDDSHIQSIDMGRIDWRAIGQTENRDELRSYGPHFPLVQAIRERRGNRQGKTRLWLLNGDTWGGNGGFGHSTSSQQAMVRNQTQATDIPSIILPFSAIDAARIEHASIRPLVQDEETWEAYTHTQPDMPADGHWEPVHEHVEGTGHYWHEDTGTHGPKRYATMEDIPADIRAFFDADGNPIRTSHRSSRVVFGRRVHDYVIPNSDYASGRIETTDWSGRPRDWIYVPPCYRLTGRKFVGPTPTGWEREWTHNPDGSWSQERNHHTLGQSVFRAAYVGDNGKRYFANFLSGIDNSPHGSGYFLVQLPKGADVSSVQSAIESLKPNSVKAAESMGIEVKRQGDLFAIPTEFTLRQLRKMGADIRQSKLHKFGFLQDIRTRWNDIYVTTLMEQGIPTSGYNVLTPEQKGYRDGLRRTLLAKADAEIAEFDRVHAIHGKRELYGTRHVGTDIAILPNGVTLARGTIRHTGGQHRYLSLGKVWHIVARNTVPLAR